MTKHEKPKAGGAYIRDGKSGALKKAGTNQPVKSVDGTKQVKVPSTKTKPASDAKSDVKKGK